MIWNQWLHALEVKRVLGHLWNKGRVGDYFYMTFFSKKAIYLSIISKLSYVPIITLIMYMINSMKILFVAAEVAPFVSVGGLSQVMYFLPKH